MTADPAHVAANGLAATSIFASWFWLPPAMAFVASALAAVWYCIQIYDWYRKP